MSEISKITRNKSLPASSRVAFPEVAIALQSIIMSSGLESKAEDTRFLIDEGHLRR